MTVMQYFKGAQMTVKDDRAALRAGILELLERMRAEERRFERELSDGERTEDGSAKN